MRFVTDRSELQAPGICFVCETAPQAGAVDTLQNHTPGFVSPLAGRKIICEGCLTGAANVAGFVSDRQASEAKRVAEEAVARFNAVRDHVATTLQTLTDDVIVAVAEQSPTVIVNALEDEVAPKKRAKKADVSEA